MWPYACRIENGCPSTTGTDAQLGCGDPSAVGAVVGGREVTPLSTPCVCMRIQQRALWLGMGRGQRSMCDVPG